MKQNLGPIKIDEDWLRWLRLDGVGLVSFCTHEKDTFFNKKKRYVCDVNYA